jgi:hypothetical protein
VDIVERKELIHAISAPLMLHGAALVRVARGRRLAVGLGPLIAIVSCSKPVMLGSAISLKSETAEGCPS